MIVYTVGRWIRGLKVWLNHASRSRFVPARFRLAVRITRVQVAWQPGSPRFGETQKIQSSGSQIPSQIFEPAKKGS